MDTSIELTDVQDLNLIYLLTVQASVKTDLIAAAYKFHLPHELAITLARMSVGELRAVVSTMQYECLFEPVANFTSLLMAPPSLAPILSAVGARPDALFPPPGPADLPS